MRRFNFLFGVFGRSIAQCVLLVWVMATAVYAGDVVSETEARLLDAVKYLASDELEGRGVGTEGLDLAAKFIHRQFTAAGLNVQQVHGSGYQEFQMTVTSKLGSPNRLTLQGPHEKQIPLQHGADFQTMSFGGSGGFSAIVAFVGYGIDAPHLEYNDFAGLDVKGKAVIILRRTPQQGNPHGKFAGPHGGLSRHAELRTKVGNAYGAGAAAILFVNDPYTDRSDLQATEQQIETATQAVVDAAVALDMADPDDTEKFAAAREQLSQTINTLKNFKAEFARGEQDELMKFDYADGMAQHSIPIMHVTRAACDEMLASQETSLAKLEEEIDGDLKPRSMILTGWTAGGQTSIERVKARVKNVIGVLEADGPLANQTIIIGAHYDHLGRGGANSLAPGSHEIHNGADDNASGVAALIELARRLAGREEKLSRRVVFIAFTGEEMGLIGSARYVNEPLFPLEHTVAMFNMDMVGRLRDDKLIVFGTGTAPRWDGLLARLAMQHGLHIITKIEGFGPSDHSSFYGKEIPVLHFFTGNHSDYHRPGDDWEKINATGMRRVIDLIEQVIVETASNSPRPKYIAVKSPGNMRRTGSRPYFGSIPDFGQEVPGYALSGVSPGSPAQKGGLKAGDVIIGLQDQKIGNLSDFDLALRKHKAGETVEVTVKRGSSKLLLKVTLDKPR